jgi:hypothetical protein
MKHWIPDEGAIPLADRASDASVRRAAPRRCRARQSELGSRIGLAIAIAFVVGLAWAIAPSSPVARELRR